MIQPPFDAFQDGYAAGKAQIVTTTLVGDLETPVSAFMKLAADRSHSSCSSRSRVARRAGATR